MKKTKGIKVCMVLSCLFLPCFSGYIPFNIDFVVGHPIKEFGDNIARPGFGVNLGIGINVWGAPVAAGLDVSWMTYAREKKEPTYQIDTSLVRMRQKISSKIFSNHFYLRLESRKYKCFPYIEGVIGYKYLYTKSRFRVLEMDGLDDISFGVDDRDIYVKDFTFSYGFGLGLMFFRDETFSVELGMRYLRGTEGEYINIDESECLEENTADDGSVELSFSPYTSSTGMIVYMLGLRWYILGEEKKR